MYVATDITKFKVGTTLMFFQCGPLLFNGINSIPTSSDTQTVLYADDLLFHPISLQQDFTTLQWDIMAIVQWVFNNQLTFNTTNVTV